MAPTNGKQSQFDFVRIQVTDRLADFGLLGPASPRALRKKRGG